MNSKNNILGFITAFLCLSFNSAQGFEFITSRGNGMGKTILISQPSASTLLILPSRGIEKGEWIIELGGMQEFELSQLNHAYLAAAARFGNYTAALGLSQLGQRDYYSERTGKISLGYQWENCNFGINLSDLQYSFGGNYSSQSAGTAGVAFTYSYNPLLVGMAADNLNSPKITENSPAINPQYTLFAEFIGKGAYSLLGRLTIEEQVPLQLALAQKIEVSNRSSLFWGFQTIPFQLGIGFDAWYNKQGTITYSGSYHPTLGVSHNFSVIYHLGKVKKTEEKFE